MLPYKQTNNVIIMNLVYYKVSEHLMTFVFRIKKMCTYSESIDIRLRLIVELTLYLHMHKTKDSWIRIKMSLSNIDH